MKHLSDEDIQDYLDGNTPQKLDSIENHLRTCADCQILFNQYKNLYIDLKQEPQFKLSEQLVPAIMKDLSLTPKTRPLYRYITNFLFGIGFLWLTIITIVIAYLINSKPWKEIHDQSSSLLSDLQALFFVSIDRVFSDLIGKPYLLLFAGLIMLTLAVIDHWIIQPKFKNLSS